MVGHSTEQNLKQSVPLHAHRDTSFDKPLPPATGGKWVLPYACSQAYSAHDAAHYCVFTARDAAHIAILLHMMKFASMWWTICVVQHVLMPLIQSLLHMTQYASNEELILCSWAYSASARAQDPDLQRKGVNASRCLATTGSKNWASFWLIEVCKSVTSTSLCVLWNSIVGSCLMSRIDARKAEL